MRIELSELANGNTTRLPCQECKHLEEQLVALQGSYEKMEAAAFQMEKDYKDAVKSKKTVENPKKQIPKSSTETTQNNNRHDTKSSKPAWNSNTAKQDNTTETTKQAEKKPSIKPPVPKLAELGLLKPKPQPELEESELEESEYESEFGEDEYSSEEDYTPTPKKNRKRRTSGDPSKKDVKASAVVASSVSSGVLKDLNKHTVAQLKTELKARGLPVKGLKADLVSRLEVAMKQESTANDEESGMLGIGGIGGTSAVIHERGDTNKHKPQEEHTTTDDTALDVKPGAVTPKTAPEEPPASSTKKLFGPGSQRGDLPAANYLLSDTI